MGEATVACCYFVFALMFAVFNILNQNVTVRSQMRQSVVTRYTSMPFQFQPEYPYEGISTTSELYEWMRQAFVPVTFAETPVMGRGHAGGFCSKSYPCLIHQGECTDDDQCMTGLACRDHRTLREGVMTNGFYWDKQELLDWCNYLGTPVDLSLDGSTTPPNYQNCTASPTVSSALGPCCWDWKGNAYITLIQNASSSSQIDATFNLLGRGSCPVALSPDMDCCSKNTSEALLPSEIDHIKLEESKPNPRPVNVGNFNRLVYMRFTLKRFKKVRPPHPSKAFASLVPYGLSGGGNALSPDSDNGDAEDKGTQTSYVRWEDRQYNWVKEGSFNGGGGYVEVFYPSSGRNELYILLQRLWLDGFFDRRLATFVVDMMFYNGQSDNFMHVAFKFVFHPGGACHKIHEVRFASMMSNSWEGKYLIGHLLEIGLVLFVVFFVVCEIRKAQDIGFGGLSSIVDCSSLLLCTFALIFNFALRLEPVYRNFKFKDDPVTPLDSEGFEDVIALQNLMAIQARIVAINLLMIFFRAVVMITSLDSTVGLIINTLGKSMVNIIYFCVTFFFLMLGSVAFAFFTFGSNPRKSGMSSPIMTFYVTFAMLMGQQDFEGLHAADPAMAYPFFFAFYILVLFVMLNMFVSILLSGYDICVASIKKDEVGLFRRIADEVRQDVVNKFLARSHTLFNTFVLPCLVGFSRGVTACFQETYDRIVSGMTIPTMSQLFNSCCWCCKNRSDPNEEFKRELKWAKDLAKMARNKMNRIKMSSPTEADRIEEKVNDVDEIVHNEERRMQVDQQDYKIDLNQLKKLRESLLELDELVENSVENASYSECCLALSFMIVFSAMLVIMARGEDTFYLSRANMDFGTKASWVTNRPLRIFEYDEIDSMEHAGEFAGVLIGNLYGSLGCRVHKGGDEPLTFSECNPGSDEYAIVQEVRNWNIGFLNTTFLRLSIQPGCYVDNPRDRWFYGARHLRAHAMSGLCLDAACFENALSEEGSCKNHAGVPFDPNSIVTAQDSLDRHFYNYSEHGKLGPFQLYGGITVSFGRTLDDAQDMLHKLKKDGWFTKRSAALTFDYVTYNGNLDMFSHSVFGFSLLASGKVVVRHHSQNFALHFLEAGGPFHGWRKVVFILFLVYVTMVFGFVSKTVYDLCVMRSKGKRLKHRFYYFVFAYYKNLWNRTDSLSLLITLISLLVYVLYLVNAFRLTYKFSIDDASKYQVPLSDASKFGMPAEVSPSRYLQDDWYVFHQFEELGKTYSLYLNLAAINAFFIAVKIVKYANAVPQFKHFASTLADGAEQMMYFSIVILLLLFGWSLFFFFWFGVHINGLQDVFFSMYRCFSWILGDFEEDMKGMLQASLLEALVGFVLFQVMMYFICLNMFLATMLNTYCDTVGRTEVEREHQRLQSEQKHDIIDVEYDDKDDLKNDINIKKDELGDVWVVSVNNDVEKGAKAKEKGVMEGGPGIGSLIIKVNGDRHDWKDFQTEAEIFEEGINPDAAGDNKIHITFKAPKPKNRRWLERYATLFGNADDDREWQGITPTVKSFWRGHGAVAWIQTQSQRNIEPDDVPDMEELDGDEVPKAEGVGAIGSSVEERQRRIKLKHRLDTLLFSVNRKKGKQPVDGSLAENEANLNSTDDGKFEDELELDALRNRIEGEPVAGDEVWLDCLMTAIEHEMEDESYVTEVLRTNDMTEMTKGQVPAKLDSVNNFYRLAFEILSILEFKAKQKWYQKLQEESVERLELLNRQNSILHDYCCELEESFVDVMQKIHAFKGEKDQMVEQLGCLLDATAYGDRLKQAETDRRKQKHMERLTIPWPDTVTNTKGRGHHNNLSMDSA